MKKMVVICVGCFMLMLPLACGGPRAVMPYPSNYRVPDYKAFSLSSVAVLPIYVNLTYECLRTYEQAGAIRPTNEEISTIFYPASFHEVEKRKYQVLSLADMEDRLIAHGLMNPMQIHGHSPTKLGEILDVDGLVYVTVTDITSLNKIRFTARMVETKHGLTLWSDRYWKAKMGGVKGMVVGGFKGLIVTAGFAASIFTAGQSAPASMQVADTMGNTIYKAVTSVDKEIAVAVEDCFDGLPRGRRSR